MRGLLRRHIPVRLVNVSVGGLLVESEREISVRTIGKLQLDLDGSPRQDHIHVTRSVLRRGANHSFLLGGALSWAARPQPDSLREAARAMNAPTRTPKLDRWKTRTRPTG